MCCSTRRRRHTTVALALGAKRDSAVVERSFNKIYKCDLTGRGWDADNFSWETAVPRQRGPNNNQITDTRKFSFRFLYKVLPAIFKRFSRLSQTESQCMETHRWRIPQYRICAHDLDDSFLSARGPSHQFLSNNLFRIDYELPGSKFAGTCNDSRNCCRYHLLQHFLRYRVDLSTACFTLT